MAANAMDDKIMSFCDSHPTILSDRTDALDRANLVKELSAVVKDRFKAIFKVRQNFIGS